MDNDERSPSRSTSNLQAVKWARLFRLTIRPTRKQTEKMLALLDDNVVEAIGHASIPPLTDGDQPKDEVDLTADIGAPMLVDLRAEQREQDRITNIDQDPHPDILPR